MDFNITVVDFNDTVPTLLNFSASINENVKPNVYVGRIEIFKTGDTNITNIVLNGDGNESFEVDNAGVITTSDDVNLDYETKSFYTFKAIATNVAGDSNATDVNITINDIEDESNLYIQSAIYDTNQTDGMSDDKLYIYFSKDINTSTLNSVSDDINISGTYDFGASVTMEYNSSNFYRYVVDMNSSGNSFLESEHNVSIVNDGDGALQDIYGQFPTSFPQTKIEKNILIFKTSVESKNGYDDGNYSLGYDTNFTRSGTEVTDNLLDIIWDDDSNVANDTRDYNNAVKFCNEDKGAVGDWRLPTKAELLSIVNRDSNDSSPAIYSTFENTKSNGYWSISEYKPATTQAWYVNFNDGNDAHADKDDSKYIRCIKAN
jgi:hypothetical protein